MNKHKTPAHAGILMGLLFILQISFCTGQVNEKVAGNPSSPLKQSTIFPQIHTNLNGMVSEFVRTMYQDKKGNYWFGSNGNGIIRYDGLTLEKITLGQKQQWVSVREIVEDNAGNVWFATSSGLVKYDGEKFSTYSTEVGLQHEEIWGLAVDAHDVIWVGSLGGVSHFDGQTFKPFSLPDTVVEDPQYMLSDKLVTSFLEDKNGIVWLVTDGNGIFKYHQGAFTHLTRKNGLTDNNVSDILEDKQGNIWIGTYYGGLSKFDGTTYTNFTREGVIEGVEIGSLYEDHRGHIWFSAENIGAYRYDGIDFTRFTTENGLTTHGIQSIFEDQKGQLWFGTWQGLCIYDGHDFTNAKNKEPWTN